MPENMEIIHRCVSLLEVMWAILAFSAGLVSNQTAETFQSDSLKYLNAMNV